MPASKKAAAAAASTTGRALAQGAKAPSARATARKASKSAPIPTQSDEHTPAVRRAPQDPSAYAVTAWGDSNFELTTPGGQTCLVRELGIEGLIEMGLLDTLNGLAGIVANETLPKSGPPAQQFDMKALMKDPHQLVTLIELLNKVVVAAVVAPRIHAVVDQNGQPVEKEIGKVYVDSIPLEDRMFLFTELTGGLDKFASFR